MEYRGQAPQIVYGTIHFGDPFPDNRSAGNAYWSRFAPLAGGFHVFALEWEPGVLRWYVDDTLYSVTTAADLRGAAWPFDRRFHFLLNVAVGGTFVGDVDDSIFPQSMEVDYVRVYHTARPALTGPYSVAANASGLTYSVASDTAATSYAWSVPAGATIVSGQGTRTMTVNWGTTGGDVALQLGSGCGGATMRMPVFVQPPQSLESVLEDFEANRNLTFGSASGTLADAVQNPSPSGVNPSPVVGRYTRSSSQKYDTLVYGIGSITDAGAFVSGARRFTMDVYTPAPIGTEVSLQLENGGVATGSTTRTADTAATPRARRCRTPGSG